MPKKSKPSFAEPLQQVDRTFVRWRGRKLIYFGGCDYLRLSTHPKILHALTKGLERHGLNVSASRKTTGNHVVYGKLEAVAARFFGADRACLVSSGYMTNLVVAQALRGSISHSLLDERAHSSLKDAAVFLGSPISLFKHRDWSDLAKKYKKIKNRSGIALLTDGLFAHDGSFAPLRQYRQILGMDVLLWVDDAHAGGIVGKKGQGSLEAAGLNRHNSVQTITFSKAFGVYGGAVLCEESLGDRILEHSSAITGNTPLPLPLAAAVLESLRLVRVERDLRKQLAANIELFWDRIGLRVSLPLAPIISLNPLEPEKVRASLLRKQIYPSFIRYPGGPEQGYFRFALSSEHTPAQVTALADVLASAELLGPS